MPYRIFPKIRTPEDLGKAYLGDPNTAVVPPICHINRAGYGRKIAEAEGGKFTPFGYIVPTKKNRRKRNAA